MTMAVGPALLSKLSNAQAVLRPTQGQRLAWRSCHTQPLSTLHVSLRALKPASLLPGGLRCAVAWPDLRCLLRQYNLQPVQSLYVQGETYMQTFEHDLCRSRIVAALF